MATTSRQTEQYHHELAAMNTIGVALASTPSLRMTREDTRNYGHPARVLIDTESGVIYLITVEKLRKLPGGS